VSYYRSDHYRWRNGQQEWVRGHEVHKDTWYSGVAHFDYKRERLSQLGVTKHEVSRYLNPNARCPRCELPVFYFQNEHGSRVFFDTLAPDWIKHPCTDNQQPVERSPIKIRPPLEVAEIGNLLKAVGPIVDSDSIENRCEPATTLQRLRIGETTFAIVQVESGQRDRRVYRVAKPGKWLQRGVILLIRKGVAWPIRFDDLNPRPIPIARVRGLGSLLAFASATSIDDDVL
jgi:hypothetical protein